MNRSRPDEVQDETQPDLWQADWQPEQVLALFADLAMGADVQHVQIRCPGEHGVDDRAATLGEAQAMFAEGQAQAIQIRYRFEGESWSDTIMPAPGHASVIRCRLPSP